MDFEQLGLCPQLLRAVAEQGYDTPSPIQQQAIPPVLDGRDLLGCAQTGTGKTAAFALPLLQRLAGQKKKPLRVLILTPTRELALQIGESIEAYAKYTKLGCCVIFGGVGQNPQVQALKKGPDVLVATPGRLNDLIGQGLLDIGGVEAFVLDEADRMLDMGFIHDVKRVLAKLPAKRQTLLFSATMPPAIEQLAAGMLHEPVFVKVTPPATTVEAIDQRLCHVDKGDKRALLAWLLTQEKPASALVFTRTKHGANKVAKNLIQDGFTAAAIHGNKSQSARQTALADFKNGRVQVLVATDIAARGIDISELELVVNFDLPHEPETYVHRIGRTGRAGQAGRAVSFCCAEERDDLNTIQKLIKQAIPVLDGHPWPAQGAPAPAPAAAPARAPQTRQSEDNTMDEQQTSSSARRRRRRSRKPAAQQNAAAPRPERTERAERPERAPRPERPARPAQPRQNAERAAKPAAPAQRGRRGGQSQNRDAAPRPQRSQTRPAQPAPQPADNEDAGLLLITRKAPAAKYASFEEYMKNHSNEED